MDVIRIMSAIEPVQMVPATINPVNEKSRDLAVVFMLICLFLKPLLSKGTYILHNDEVVMQDKIHSILEMRLTRVWVESSRFLS